MAKALQSQADSIPGDLYPIKEISLISGVSLKTLYTWKRTGEVRCWGRRLHYQMSLSEVMPLTKPTKPKAANRFHSIRKRKAA